MALIETLHFSRTRSAGLRLVDYLALHRSRRALAKLDARALCDVGISQYEALAETRRPIWDAPASWKA